MTALLSAIMALIFLAFSCGNQFIEQPSDVSAITSGGRLMCAGFSRATEGRETISGCTETNQLTASSQSYTLQVVRERQNLNISLQNKTTGDAWSGIATLQFPTGGTGTRARAIVKQPILAVVSCDYDSLLRCPGR
jgi:hypothetical protein